MTTKKLKLQDRKECFFCGKTEGLARHHVYGGTANRRKSETYGCVVWLCGPHHNLSTEGVHFNKKRDLQLKQYTQREFEKLYGHDKFMETFHRNYLGDMK